MKNVLTIVIVLSSLIVNVYSQCNGSNLLCNKKYNEVAYLTTHNAYNSDEDNFSLPNQNFNITTQLNEGVRALMIDVYDLLGTPSVYHGTSILGSAPFVDYLMDIKTFLDLNPNEVVTIILECYISANDIENDLTQAGLMPYLYAHNPANSWPTLQTMINNGERLVIFSDEDDATTNQDWYHYVWDHAVETHYSNHSQNDFSCDFNRGDSINDLFILNHFVTNSVLGTGDESQSAIVNANPYFINRVLQCEQEKNKFPNFITVDFYELGNCMDVVDQMNGIITSINPEKTSLSEMVKVFPNPSSSNFSLELHKKIKPPLEIKILDQQGRQIHEISNIIERKINITYPLDSGFYYLIIKDKKNKIYNQKIINVN